MKLKSAPSFYERDILLESLAAIEALGAGELSGPMAAELRQLGHPYRPAQWRGAILSPAERTRYSLTAAKLEAAGMIRRVAAMAGRTTHIALTAAGVKRAIEIARADGGSPDREAIDRGIELCDWIDADDPATA